MSFLGNMGLDTIDATGSDWSIANGVYPAVVSDSKIMNPKKDANKQLWQITYTLDQDVDEYGGRSASEFFDLDPNLPSERRVWLKRRLISLGVTDEQAATLEPADIIGVEVSVTIQNKNVGDKTYVNIRKVALRDATAVANPLLSNF